MIFSELSNDLIVTDIQFTYDIKNLFEIEQSK